MKPMRRGVLILPLSLVALACQMGPREPDPAQATKDPTPAKVATPEAPKVERLGATFDAAATQASLGDVAKDAKSYAGKTFVTTGTITAVCQHRGCWMEIKDDASEAHVKMAGHAFFVPRSAKGRKARVYGALVPSNAPEPSCGEHAARGEKGQGCKAEAEAQLGHPLAKLELEARGVELL